MTKARTLADFISDGSEFADGTISVSEVSGAAPLASPTFTGTVALSSGTPILDITDTDTGVDHQINGSSGIGNLAINVDTNGEGSNAGLVFRVGGTSSANEYFRLAANGDARFFDSSSNVLLFVDESGGIVLNDNSADKDFRVESNNATHALFVQGSSGNVGLNGVVNPATTLDLGDGWMRGYGMYLEDHDGTKDHQFRLYVYNDNFAISRHAASSGTGAYEDELMKISSGGNVTFNDSGVDADFRVETDSRTHGLFLDASTDVLHVGGSTQLTSTGFLNCGGVTFSNGGATGGKFFSWDNEGGSTNQRLFGYWYDGSAYKARFVLPGDTSEFVFNDSSEDLDFRVESDGNANMFAVDGGNNLVSFGKFGGGSTSYGGYFSAAGSGFFHQVLTNTTTDSTQAILYLNRQSSDGTLIQFRHNDSSEGTISVSGSTVSYNGFSGRHESSGIPTNTPVGTVVSTIDELDVYPNTTTDIEGNTITHKKAGQTRADHPKVEVSSSEGDSCVYGIVSEFDDDGKLIVTSVGIGSVRVTGSCAKGDLLESNGDGTAKVQSDDIVRSKTLGKVTIGNSDTGVKLVSCVLYCG